MKKLVKRSESDILRITIEAYGCGDPCTCACAPKSVVSGEPGGSGAPQIKK